MPARPKTARQWPPVRVGEWVAATLEDAGQGAVQAREAANKFIENDVDGDLLIELTTGLLKDDLGVQDFRTRVVLFKAIRRLRQHVASVEAQELARTWGSTEGASAVEQLPEQCNSDVGSKESVIFSRLDELEESVRQLRAIVARIELPHNVQRGRPVGDDLSEREVYKRPEARGRSHEQTTDDAKVDPAPPRLDSPRSEVDEIHTAAPTELDKSMGAMKVFEADSISDLESRASSNADRVPPQGWARFRASGATSLLMRQGSVVSIVSDDNSSINSSSSLFGNTDMRVDEATALHNDWTVSLRALFLVLVETAPQRSFLKNIVFPLIMIAWRYLQLVAFALVGPLSRVYPWMQAGQIIFLDFYSALENNRLAGIVAQGATGFFLLTVLVLKCMVGYYFYSNEDRSSLSANLKAVTIHVVWLQTKALYMPITRNLVTAIFCRETLLCHEATTPFYICLLVLHLVDTVVQVANDYESDSVADVVIRKEHAHFDVLRVFLELGVASAAASYDATPSASVVAMVAMALPMMSCFLLLKPFHIRKLNAWVSAMYFSSLYISVAAMLVEFLDIRDRTTVTLVVFAPWPLCLLVGAALGMLSYESRAFKTFLRRHLIKLVVREDNQDIFTHNMDHLLQSPSRMMDYSLFLEENCHAFHPAAALLSAVKVLQVGGAHNVAFWAFDRRRVVIRHRKAVALMNIIANSDPFGAFVVATLPTDFGEDDSIVNVLYEWRQVFNRGNVMTFWLTGQKHSETRNEPLALRQLLFTVLGVGGRNVSTQLIVDRLMKYIYNCKECFSKQQAMELRKVVQGDVYKVATEKQEEKVVQQLVAAFAAFFKTLCLPKCQAFLHEVQMDPVFKHCTTSTKSKLARAAVFVENVTSVDVLSKMTLQGVVGKVRHMPLVVLFLEFPHHEADPVQWMTSQNFDYPRLHIHVSKEGSQDEDTAQAFATLWDLQRTRGMHVLAPDVAHSLCVDCFVAAHVRGDMTVIAMRHATLDQQHENCRESIVDSLRFPHEAIPHTSFLAFAAVFSSNVDVGVAIDAFASYSGMSCAEARLAFDRCVGDGLLVQHHRGLLFCFAFEELRLALLERISAEHRVAVRELVFRHFMSDTTSGNSLIVVEQLLELGMDNLPALGSDTLRAIATGTLPQVLQNYGDHEAIRLGCFKVLALIRDVLSEKINWQPLVSVILQHHIETTELPDGMESEFEEFSAGTFMVTQAYHLSNRTDAQSIKQAQELLKSAYGHLDHSNLSDMIFYYLHSAKMLRIQKKAEEALKEYRKAYDLCLKAPSSRFINVEKAKALSGQAMCLREMKNYKRAILFFNNALNIFENEFATLLKPDCQHGLALTSIYLGVFESARNVCRAVADRMRKRVFVAHFDGYSWAVVADCLMLDDRGLAYDVAQIVQYLPHSLEAVVQECASEEVTELSEALAAKVKFKFFIFEVKCLVLYAAHQIGSLLASRNLLGRVHEVPKKRDGSNQVFDDSVDDIPPEVRDAAIDKSAMLIKIACLVSKANDAPIELFRGVFESFLDTFSLSVFNLAMDTVANANPLHLMSARYALLAMNMLARFNLEAVVTSRGSVLPGGPTAVQSIPNPAAADENDTPIQRSDTSDAETSS